MNNNHSETSPVGSLPLDSYNKISEISKKLKTHGKWMEEWKSEDHVKISCIILLTYFG